MQRMIRKTKKQMEKTSVAFPFATFKLNFGSFRDVLSQLVYYT